MASPKEFASILLAKHEAVIEQHCNQSSRKAHYKAAKLCAIITVGEMLYHWAEIFGQDEKDQADIKYWNKIKKELELL